MAHAVHRINNHRHEISETVRRASIEQRERIDCKELDVERWRIDFGHEGRRDDVEEHLIAEERVEIVHVLNDHARNLRFSDCFFIYCRRFFV